MRKLNSIYFSVWNGLIQDGNTDEYHVGQRSLFSLHGDADEPLLLSEEKKVFIQHIKDNHYEIRGYVYESECAYALININGIKISVCNKNIDYQPNTMYEGKVSLAYDIWSCYGMNVCDSYDDEGLYLEGITKSIKLPTADTSNSITLEQTSCWKDEENYEDATSQYLIEVDLCEDKILYERPHPLQIDNQRLVLNLEGISQDKINKIKAFIKKVI